MHWERRTEVLMPMASHCHCGRDFGLKLKDRELAGERNRAKRKYILTL